MMNIKVTASPTAPASTYVQYVLVVTMKSGNSSEVQSALIISGFFL